MFLVDAQQMTIVLLQYDCGRPAFPSYDRKRAHKISNFVLLDLKNKMVKFFIIFNLAAGSKITSDIHALIKLRVKVLLKYIYTMRNNNNNNNNKQVDD